MINIDYRKLVEGDNYCKFFVPYKDIHGDIVLIFCSSVDNKDNKEGNCNCNSCPNGHFKKVFNCG